MWQNIIRLLSRATGVKRQKVGFPLFWLRVCPDFDVLVCFCDFEERDNNISPHQRNSKMAPAISRAHNSRHVCVKHGQSCKLSFSEIDLSCTYGQAKTLRSYEWTWSFLKTEKKSCVLKRIRIRVDRAWVTFSGDRGIKKDIILV